MAIVLFLAECASINGAALSLIIHATFPHGKLALPDRPDRDTIPHRNFAGLRACLRAGFE